MINNNPSNLYQLKNVVFFFICLSCRNPKIGFKQSSQVSDLSCHFSKIKVLWSFEELFIMEFALLFSLTWCSSKNKFCRNFFNFCSSGFFGFRNTTSGIKKHVFRRISFKFLFFISLIALRESSGRPICKYNHHFAGHFKNHR